VDRDLLLRRSHLGLLWYLVLYRDVLIDSAGVTAYPPPRAS
jgi:hypothetical protein